MERLTVLNNRYHTAEIKGLPTIVLLPNPGLWQLKKFGEAISRLATYEDTGLTPEEINKIVSGSPVKVSFDIGDKGFLTAINAAFKERYGVTADECSKTISDLKAERDTLEKALEMACRDNDLQPYGDMSLQHLMGHYIQQAQEQEGKKL